MIIAKRLKQLRTDNKISQATLAKAIGVDISSISYWESETYEPKASYVYKMAIFFNVSSDYLLGLEDESGRKIYSTKNNTLNR